MTSAHRPTWNSAKGKADPGGARTVPSSIVSAKNQPGLLQLKRRSDYEILNNKSKDTLREELLLKENKKCAVNDDNTLKLDEDKEKSLQPICLNQLHDDDEKSDSKESSYSSKSINDEESGSEEDKRSDMKNHGDDNKNLISSKSNSNNDDESDNNEEEDDSDNEEDEEEELMREYEKIKKEKEEQKRLKQIEEAERVKSRTPLEILSGNPIYAQNYSLKRKWYDDTVFKNQAKEEKKPEKRFINDTVRSDFHKKFMYKTIQ